MKTKEWIIKKLEENNWNSSIVSDLYEEYCRDFTTPCKRDSFTRSVRFYKSKERPLNNLKNPMKKDEVTTKEEIFLELYLKKQHKYFNDVKEGDIVEAFKMVEIPR